MSGKTLQSASPRRASQNMAEYWGGRTIRHRWARPSAPRAATPNGLAPEPAEITHLLHQWHGGDQQALGRLTPLVYDELDRLARACMARERPGHLLQETGLISETYLRLMRLRAIEWQDRKHFLRVCAQIMRRILVDYARNRLRQKNEGAAPHIPLEETVGVPDARTDLVALDEAVQSLAVLDPRKAQVVELRFFGGFSVKDTAELLSISERSVKQDWHVAKLWLLRELEGRHG